MKKIYNTPAIEAMNLNIKDVITMSVANVATFNTTGGLSNDFDDFI